MQPPPRKGNYAKFLKNLHTEQITKLLVKNQHECDLLEDIRSYTLKRSAIEKSYSEALLKISSAYLNKKNIPQIPDIKTEGGKEKWNMWNVWHTVLEENEKLARARLAAVEVFHQQIADDAKHLRAFKSQCAKKLTDQLVLAQKDLQTCVQDVDKTKKFYFDEEHSAHDVRDKAKDIEEKLKKKKGSFFQSITSLQKNSAKVSSRRDVLEEKSTGARNDYLLSLAAANAHQTRYFVVDLQNTLMGMEANVFEKVAGYLTLIGRTELLTCTATQTSFTRIRDQSQQLTREYNLQCCYLYFPVLKQHVQYEFEPCENDNVTTVTAEQSSAQQQLNKDAKRWATRIARETANVREALRKAHAFQALRDSGHKVDPNDQNGPDLETKIEELKIQIRRSETAKAKAEARIECLRAGGINVDEWMQELDSLSVQDIHRSASSLSVRTDASGQGEQASSDSFYDSDGDGPVLDGSADGGESSRKSEDDTTSVDGTSTSGGGGTGGNYTGGSATAGGGSTGGGGGTGGGGTTGGGTAGGRTHRDSDVEVDGEWAMLEQERQRLEQLTAGWDDPTHVDWGPPPATSSESPPAPDSAGTSISGPSTSAAAPSGTALLRCTALYSYTAQNPDELSIVENEALEVVGEGDGDGWVKARNYRGQEGFVPQNYLDIDQASVTGGTSGEQSATGQLANQFSFSSVDYTVHDAEEFPAVTGVGVVDHVDIDGPQIINKEDGMRLEDHKKPKPLTLYSWCLASYDYEGTTEEGELSFKEGQIIKVLRKRVHGDVDDGWWEGELPDGTKGFFPSLVAEECNEDGEPLTPEEDSGPRSAPPIFTPPEVPAFLLLAPNTIITQATPIGDLPITNPTAAQPTTLETLEEADDSEISEATGNSSDGKFAMVLTRDKRHKYGSQFDPDDETPSIQVDVPEVKIGEAEESPGPQFTIPMIAGDTDDGLGVAQIVITAATPMIEEAETPFPPPPEESAHPENEPEEENESTIEDIVLPEAPAPVAPAEEEPDPEDDMPTDSAPFPVSSSTASEEDSLTGPSTAENSQRDAVPKEKDNGNSSKAKSKPEPTPTPAPPPPPPPPLPEQVEEEIPMSPLPSGAGQRGSIPDELAPHQLARLQDLKESNA